MRVEKDPSGHSRRMIMEHKGETVEGWIEGNTLFNLLRNNMTEKDFKNALRIAVEQGLVSIEVKDGKRGLAIPKHTTH